MIAPLLGYAALVLGLQGFDWNQGWARAALLVTALVGIAWLGRRPAAGKTFNPPWLTPLLAVLVVAHIGFYATKASHPRLVDIATTTIAAGEALAAGESPYSQPIDAEALAKTGEARFGGYKYGPVTALAYMPLSLLFGARGFLFENLLFDLAGGLVIYALGRRFGVGKPAVALWLATPMVADQIIGRGVTEPIAILPALLGLLLFERKPFIAGLLIGLSISAKLMPGVVFLVGCVPPGGRARLVYAVGALLGLSPLIAVALWDAKGVTTNLFVFNALRAPDTTSWLGMLSPALMMDAKPIARAIGLLGLATLAITTLFRPPGMRGRIAALGVTITMLVLTGPAAHQNYMLWWLPISILLVVSPLSKVPDPIR